MPVFNSWCMKNLFFLQKHLLLAMCCSIAFAITFSQPLFSYGGSEVGKDEFVRVFKKNINQIEDRDKSARSYLEMYLAFKLKVKAAKDMRLDTLEHLKYDLMNFRKRLENDYPINVKEALAKTNFKINPLLKNEDLFRFADSVTLIKENPRKYPIAKETLFVMAGTVVKAGDWLNYVKIYKKDIEQYKNESYEELLEKFIATTVTKYYRNHLEEYNPDFKFQLQDFKEGNLLFEVMEKKVWNKAASDIDGLKDFYQKNNDHFLWTASADVILVNAKSYAYADYASENIKKGQSWKKIAAESEGMIQADSARYEIAQLPVKAGTKMVEGTFSEIERNDADNGAAFVKVIKIYPAKLQRNFDEAKSLVINEYQKQLEETWMAELTKKYPIKINNAVLQLLIKEL